MLRSFLKLISFEEKKIIFFFSILTIVVSLTEGFGIFLISSIFGKQLSLDFQLININKFEKNILLILLIFFFFKFILLNFYSLIRIYLTTRFVEKNGEKIFRIYLNQSLNFYIQNNSSEFVRNISMETDKLSYCYDSLLRFFGELLVFFVLISILLFLNFKLTFFFILVLSFIGFLFVILSKKKLNYFSKVSFIQSAYILKNIKEAFDSVREIKIFSLNSFYLKKFKYSNFLIRQSYRYSGFIQEIPRNTLEFFVILILLLTFEYSDFFFIKKENIFDPGFIFAVIFSALRLIPGSLRIVSFFNSLNYILPSINEIFNLFKKNRKKLIIKKIKNENCFNSNIVFKNIYFKYPQQKNFTLKNINLKILKNKKYILKGESGSGKTTFVDILSGFLKPVKGSVLIDKKNFFLNDNWLGKISYMSQSSQLFDSTILENIVLQDYPLNVNKKKLFNSLKISNSNKFTDSLPGKLNYIVGENGQRLSGGQRQRVLLARCLYKDSDIIILDEFLSAIDEKNSKQILNLIKNIKNKTLILILHKFKKINFVDYVINFENSKVSLKKNQ